MAENEKRRTPRKLVSVRAYVRTETESFYGTPSKVRVRDLNRTGALLLSEKLLRTGDQVTVTLIADDGTSGILDARIVWAERTEAGEFRAGIAFRNLTPDEEYLIDLQILRSAI